MENEEHNKYYIEVIARLINVIIILLIVIVLICVFHFTGLPKIKNSEKEIAIPEKKAVASESNNPSQWQAPDTNSIKLEVNAEQIEYGRKLIRNTAFYLGPKGMVASISNGMNCQNCHLEGGTKFYGNNYSVVASTYPKFRERSGSIESIQKRVNDCVERSLDGTALDTLSEEMKAIVAYMKWVGKDVIKKEKPEGSGIKELSYLDRPANPEKGKEVYIAKCKTCHSENGEGKLNNDGTYQYPPLWGAHSYNVGAGLYRLSRFAGFVKYNMPNGASYEKPQLSDEEAWDVAAFVNSQPRPANDLKKDWPKISGKPIDHPFGPYADEFSERQHKYGPFEPIALARKKQK